MNNEREKAPKENLIQSQDSSAHTGLHKDIAVNIGIFSGTISALSLGILGIINEKSEGSFPGLLNYCLAITLFFSLVSLSFVLDYLVDSMSDKDWREINIIRTRIGEEPIGSDLPIQRRMVVYDSAYLFFSIAYSIFSGILIYIGLDLVLDESDERWVASVSILLAMLFFMKLITENFSAFRWFGFLGASNLIVFIVYNFWSENFPESLDFFLAAPILAAITIFYVAKGR
ncbi:MAG: hypothetical protein RLN96_03450 [Pseudomonadales bacterium]